MANITAKDVAELRSKTSAGMMDCKKALVEADGNMEEAVKLLREKGLAAAAKKQERIAADGLVATLKKDGYTAIIEVNTETDFVAKNETFKEFVNKVLELIVTEHPNTVEELCALKYRYREAPGTYLHNQREDHDPPLCIYRRRDQHLYSRQRRHRRCGQV